MARDHRPIGRQRLMCRRRQRRRCSCHRSTCCSEWLVTLKKVMWWLVGSWFKLLTSHELAEFHPVVGRTTASGPTVVCADTKAEFSDVSMVLRLHGFCGCCRHQPLLSSQSSR